METEKGEDKRRERCSNYLLADIGEGEEGRGEESFGKTARRERVGTIDVVRTYRILEMFRNCEYPSFLLVLPFKLSRSIPGLLRRHEEKTGQGYLKRKKGGERREDVSIVFNVGTANLRANRSDARIKKRSSRSATIYFRLISFVLSFSSFLSNFPILVTFVNLFIPPGALFSFFHSPSRYPC